MKKISEIQALIAKNAMMREELANVMSTSSYIFSSFGTDEIIEQQQALRREARRLGVIAFDYSSYEEIYEVHMRFDVFCSFVNLEDCEVKQWKSTEGDDYVRHSLKIDNLILFAIKNVSEEHKNAQAI